MDIDTITKEFEKVTKSTFKTLKVTKKKVKKTDIKYLKVTQNLDISDICLEFGYKTIFFTCVYK